MISTDDKILKLIIDNLSIEDLENIIRKKKNITKAKKLTIEEEYALEFEKWFKKKLYLPVG